MASFTSAELRRAVNLIHVGSAEAIAQALHTAYERGYRAAENDAERAHQAHLHRLGTELQRQADARGAYAFPELGEAIRCWHPPLKDVAS